MIRTILALILIFLASVSHAETNQELKIVKNSVLSLCRGGDLSGSNTSILVSGTGGVTTVLLKQLADIGVEGKIEFTKNEWDGIKPLLSNPDTYVDCIIKVTPMFLEKYLIDEKAPNMSIISDKLSFCNGYYFPKLGWYKNEPDCKKAIGHSVYAPDSDIKNVRANINAGVFLKILECPFENRNSIFFPVDMVLRGRNQEPTMFVQIDSFRPRTFLVNQHEKYTASKIQPLVEYLALESPCGIRYSYSFVLSLRYEGNNGKKHENYFDGLKEINKETYLSKLSYIKKNEVLYDESHLHQTYGDNIHKIAKDIISKAVNNNI